MRYRALLAYEGTAYHGFQWQPQTPTIQGEVERVLVEVARQRARILAAGRTDAGVHALGQVVAFDISWRHKANDLQRALNALLPPDIAVRKLECVPSDFHPRYDAQSRTYRYTILNQPWRDPLLRRVTYHLGEPLDVEAMDRAAQAVIGCHDFRAFGQPMRDGGTTVRHVFAARCWRESFPLCVGEEPLIHFEIEADAYLRRMVRRLTGALICVGRGQYSEADFVGILSGRVGVTPQGGPAVPAHGLCLHRVTYEREWSHGAV